MLVRVFFGNIKFLRKTAINSFCWRWIFTEQIRNTVYHRKLSYQQHLQVRASRALFKLSFAKQLVAICYFNNVPKFWTCVLRKFWSERIIKSSLTEQLLIVIEEKIRSGPIPVVRFIDGDEHIFGLKELDGVEVMLL